MTFREFLEEGWLKHGVQDAWDWAMKPATPSLFFHKLAARLAANSNDRQAWKQLLGGLDRLGHNREAEALRLALREGMVRLVPMKQHGAMVREMRFEFSPRGWQGEPERTQAHYDQLWRQYGPPVQPVRQAAYWDRQGNQVPAAVYGFVMANPGDLVHSWPDQKVYSHAF